MKVLGYSHSSLRDGQEMSIAVDRSYARNRRLMWGLFALLVILHHDWWFWSDGRLVFGFVSVGLAYHVLISLAAGALWGWAAFYAWPHELEETGEPTAAVAAVNSNGDGV